MQTTQLLQDRCDRLLPGGYAAFFSQDAPLFRGVTINTLRCSPQHFKTIAPFAVSASGFCDANFRLQDNEVKIGTHPYHHAGVYYGQEPSASSVASLLGVQPGDTVLDLCAAPGGKTAQLGAALAGEGLLVSNEYMPDRSKILLSNMERMGIQNAMVTNESAEHLAAAFPCYFDRILVDAPCSGEGMFRKEPAALAQHSQRLIDSCAAVGRQLLETISAALRPGGVLLYSTCTFAPEEDEGTIGWFLKRHPEFLLEKIDVPFGCTGHDSCCCEGSIDTEKVRRIYPVHGGEGHFMAKLRKKGEEARALPSAKFQVKGKKLPDEANSFFLQSFPHLAEREFYKIGDAIYLLPNEPVYLPKGLRVLRAGVMAGEVVKKRFEPHHHLFMAYGIGCTNQERLRAEDERCAAYLRGEEIDAITAADGFAAVMANEFCLGFGKVSGARLKNRYPKGLRNLK